MTISAEGAPRTIFALASAPGRAGIAVFRLSGPLTRAILSSLADLPDPRPRRATLTNLTHAGRKIDRALVLFFPAPHSFTGEDMAELHVHGGRAIREALATALRSAGAGDAPPGEFTKRAYLNGKMDLTEAEAVPDLVAAETAAQLEQAAQQADGALARLYEGWRSRLVRAHAYIEAGFDFTDQDLPPGFDAKIASEIEILRGEIEAHLAASQRGLRLRNGLRVVISGTPNAGKSSLLNMLAGRQAAIVSPVAGTTRDVIEVPLDIGGFPVILCDTAGLRDASDPVEAEGVARARAAAANADLALVLIDQTALSSSDAWPDAVPYLCVGTKSDLPAHPSMTARLDCLISIHDRSSIDALLEILTRTIDRLLGERSSPAPTQERHHRELAQCAVALTDFAREEDTVLAAECLRSAITALGHLTGRVDVEDTLDVIFREFCIGK